MSDQARRSKDSAANEHCDFDRFFAFLHNTLSSEEAHQVYQHLEHCQECRNRFYSFRQLAGGLRSSEEQYRSLVPGFLSYIDNPGPAQLIEQKKRQERLHDNLLLAQATGAYVWRKVTGRATARVSTARHVSRRAYKVRSLTVVFVVILVLGVVTLALASRSKFVPPPGQHPNPIVPATTITPTIQPPPAPSPTFTAVPGNQTSAGSGPSISICKDSPGKLYERLTICGQNFRQGDVIQLWAYMQINGHAQLHQIIATFKVGSGGQFQYAWSLMQCRNVSIVISAYDQSQHKQLGNTIRSNKSGACFHVTHNVTG